MSERQARSKRRTSTEASNGAVSEPTLEPPQKEQNITDPCVLVVRAPGSDPSNINIQIAPMNGIDPLSIPSLLRAAAKVQERELGIGD